MFRKVAVPAQEIYIDDVFVLTDGCVFPTGRKGFGPGEQEFGYVDVRPGAHMFYWLYYTTAKDWTQRPLVMWLQGGPGASSTSYGNFEEIGPLTADLKERNTTWVGPLKSKTQSNRTHSFKRVQ